MSKPIRIGIIGAGRFAIDQHVPAFNALADQFEVVAVCSRTEKSARAVADLLPNEPEVLTDTDALFARDDIEALDILLPIFLQAEVVRKALATGKHIFSEKPVETTLAAGRDLLAAYDGNSVWMVGENWRYAPAIQRAAELVGELGQLYMFGWTIFAGFLPGTRYYETEWRRDGSHPGGIVLDGGVHFIAGLRAVLGEVHEVSARAAQIRADLNPLDTLTASIQMESGLLGTMAVTYATNAPQSTYLSIGGEAGFLEVNRDGLRLHQDGELIEEIKRGSNGVKEELADFAAAVRSGKSHLNPPLQALQDLAVFEALLHSAQQNQTIHPARVVE